jgi:hypothetical protein
MGSLEDGWGFWNANGGGMTFSQGKARDTSDVGTLENYCGRRAALVAGEVERDVEASLNLPLDDGMADDSGKDEGGRLEGKIAVPDRCDYCGIGGASLRDRRKAAARGVRRPGHACAMMCAVVSAADREIRVGRGRKGEERRDQRKTEEEQQDEAGDAPHHAIVASFAGRCVDEMSAGES